MAKHCFLGRQAPTMRQGNAIFSVMAFCRRVLNQSRTRATVGFCLVATAVATASACDSGSRLVLTEQVEARGLASRLRVQFTKAADASNRAVMAVTDEASSAAAREAEQATQAVDRDIEALQPILKELAYSDDIHHLDAFKACFVGYRALDADILS